MKFFPDTAVAGEVLNTTGQKEASWFSQSHIRHTMSATISACPKPGTLKTEPLALMETLLTVPSFGPGSGSASITCTAGGWDYWSVNDLERCGPESSACLHSLGMVGRVRTRALCSPAARQGTCQGLPVLPHTLLPRALKTVSNFDYRMLPSVHWDLLTLLLLI